jgi:hypothetical protein
MTRRRSPIDRRPYQRMVTLHARVKRLPDPKSCRSWAAYNPAGDLVEGVFGSKKMAMDAITRHAETDDELASGDTYRWEFSRMPWKEVCRRGYRIRVVTVAP